ncbi:MAG: hypothetical protein JNM25_05055 [Planctomycetes bacterium]|nr:hypothetical protein [Planctomycetota bacterium]
MELGAVLPWVWCAAAALAAARVRGPGGRRWWVPGAGASLQASLHLWGWNKPIYLAGKRLMVWTGFYEERLWFKFAIGLVFFPAVAWLGWRAWRWAACLSRLQRVAMVAIVVDLLYITVRTLSVDGWMPAAIGDEPGKSRLGLALAGIAALAVLVARPRPAATGVHDATA